MKPADRVLLLAVPTPEDLRLLSSQLETGVCVVMGPEEDIRALRRSCSDLDNVMLIFDPGDGTIPWQDRFFTLASVQTADLPDLKRVLADDARILSPDTGRAFLADFLPFQRSVATYGLYNSLSQTLLRLTAPGIPDTYQGTELWDFSLVDPDNRRPVDYQRRADLLGALDKDARDRPALLHDLLANKEDGRIKLFTIATVLRHRRQHPSLYSAGEYIPLKITGEKSNHVFAFARRHEGKVSISIISRFLSTLLAGAAPPILGPNAWSDTELHLPAFLSARSRTNLFTAETISPAPRGDLLLVGQILSGYPVALLVDP